MSPDVTSGRPTGAAAARSRQASPAAVLRGLVSARTWLAIVHLMAGLFVGIALFTVVLVCLVTGIGLLPAFLAGVPVLAGTFWLCIWIAGAERARFALRLTGWRRRAARWTPRSSRNCSPAAVTRWRRSPRASWTCSR